ncbi:MAG: alpha-1,4-glucan--maltose-1-phosphate maltosyltransferase, partial [Cryomorphaceae bacterium]
TKPYRFWNWLIDSVCEKYPETIFLAEAFTRPKVMNRLAKIGFTQSYTYFTWRTNKAELSQYIRELNSDPMRQFFRPNFWPNTPDILPYELQQPNEAAYLTRFFLAATLSSNYGMYGPVYENMVSNGVPGKEEYWNSEKYQLENHPWKIENKLQQVIKLVNQIRNEHKAFQVTVNTLLCAIENEHILAYYKSDEESRDHMLCVVNMDSYYKQSGWVQVPLGKMGLAADEEYTVKDLITQASYTWTGEWNFVELNPHGLPFHCFQILI